MIVQFFFCLRGDLACNIALDAVQTVARDQGDRKEIDIKNYAKVEKVRGLKSQTSSKLSIKSISSLSSQILHNDESV